MEVNDRVTRVPHFGGFGIKEKSMEEGIWTRNLEYILLPLEHL